MADSTPVTDSADALLRSPLHDAHVALGATMGPFGGWEMPISYAGGGVKAEHTAVRDTVGLFDVSHLGKLAVTGRGAAEFINATLTNDLRKVGSGQIQYTLCCTESGGVIDDMMSYYAADDDVLLMPNAANAAAVTAALEAARPDGVVMTDRHRELGTLAVQGPRSADVMAAVGLPTDLEFMHWREVEWRGEPVRVCCGGYTGEAGFELLPTWSVMGELWEALLAEVTARGGLPAGLGARDTLRTEMGFPLHGHDLSPEISPLEGRASWAVGWDKEQFFGREALLAAKAAGPRRRLRGLEAIDKGVLRPGLDVLDADGAVVGRTTSGTFSPTLGHSIALALVDTAAGVKNSDELTVPVRRRSLRVRVTKPPFVTPAGT